MNRQILVVGVVAGLVVLATVAAAQDKKPTGTPSGTPENVEERPFGGPPPKQRSLPFGTPATKKLPTSKTCKTTTGSCELDAAQPVGASCKCDNPPRTGKIVE